MADQRISELNAITGANTADDDLFVIVDTSTNETKKITKSELTTTINNALIDGAPATLDTLNELAAALADDANFATTVTNSLAGKVDTSGDTMTGDLSFGDNDKAIFGAGSDLQIYHSGSHSYIKDSGTGDLIVQAGTRMLIQAADGATTGAIFNEDGSVQLNHNNSAKLATTSTGIDVTGTATMDGLIVSKPSSQQIYFDRNGSSIGSGSIGADVSQAMGIWADDNTKVATFYQNKDVALFEDSGTTAKFFWDASAESLGIGTASPSSHLHIYQADGNPAKITIQNTNGSGFIKADDNLLDIGGDTIRFRNSADTAERMRIDSSGNLLVGTTTLPTANTVTGVGINPSGLVTATRNGSTGGPVGIFNRTTSDGDIVLFRKDGTTVGSISTSGGTTSYNTTSDYRLKENLVALTGAVDRIKELPVHQFNFIGHNKTVDGFLAHELQAVVPEAVTGIKDGLDEEGNPEYQAIDQSKLVPLLTAALQEALARIEALEAKLP